MKKKILTFGFIMLAMCFGNLYSQVSFHSVNFFADYSYPIKTRLSVTKIDAVGGGIELRLNLSDIFSIGLTAGYSLFSLQQEDAIAQWNWRFYTERYSAIIKDNLNSDSTLAASLNPIQKMDVVPLFLTFNAELNPVKSFFIKPQIGGGVLFYTRRLYLEEIWQKKFDEVNYTFEYSYRNFASNKYGNPFSVFGGIDLGYQLSDGFMINSSFKYIYIIKTPGSFGYDQFTFNDFINFKIGLTILY